MPRNGLLTVISDALANHWLWISSVLLGYIFAMSFTTTISYYREFGIEIFPYLDLIDYPKIFIQDERLPFISAV